MKVKNILKAGNLSTFKPYRWQHT